MASGTATSDVTVGPVLTVINNRIRNLRKKLNRITLLEDSIAQGKSIIKNKEQEELLKSKPTIIAAVDELEKIHQPLSVAVKEEGSLALQCRNKQLENKPPALAVGNLPSLNGDNENKTTQSKIGPTPEGTPGPIGRVYPCKHTSADALKYGVDVLETTLKIMFHEFSKRYYVYFKFEANVLGSITLVVFRSSIERYATCPTIKELHNVKKTYKKTGQHIFEEFMNDGFNPTGCQLAITTCALEGVKTPVSVFQATEARIENVKGKFEVNGKNQTVWVNEVQYLCHDCSGIRMAMGFKGRYDGCLLCLVKDHPGVLDPIGKILVFNEDIRYGSNGTVVSKGDYDGISVAVKKVPKENGGVTEIRKLSDRHPNIVWVYDKEDNEKFVFIALEKCEGSLHDLISGKLKLKVNGTNLYLWEHINKGCLSTVLLELLRGIVSGVAFLHKEGIYNWNMKPQNVLIRQDSSITAKLNYYYKSTTGREELGWQDGIFELGILLFKGLNKDKHLFGDNEEEINQNIKNDNKKNLNMLKDMPEAHDLISHLVNPERESRPAAALVENHPFFWKLQKRISFLTEANNYVQYKKNNETTNSIIVKELNGKGKVVFGKDWEEKVDYKDLNTSKAFVTQNYGTTRLCDLLRFVRNKLSHNGISRGESETFMKNISRQFPRFFMEVYNVLKEHSEEGEAIRDHL